MHRGYGLLEWKSSYKFRCWTHEINSKLLCDWLSDANIDYEHYGGPAMSFYIEGEEDVLKFILRWSPDVEHQTFKEWQNLRRSLTAE